MKRNISSVLSLLFAVNLLSFSSRSSLNLYPTHLAALGASQSYIGFFMNIPAIMLIVFVFVFTKMADRADKRQLLGIGFAIQIVGFILMAFFHESLLLLAFLQLVASAAYAIGFTTLPNLVFEILPRGRRAGGIALFGISGVISNPVGALIGEQVLQRLGVEYLPYVGALFSLAALTLVPRVPFKKNEHHVVVHFRPLLRRRSVLVLVGPAVLLGGAWSILATFIPNYSNIRLGAPNLSLYFSTHAVVAIALRIFFSRQFDGASKRHLLAFSYISISFAMLNMVLLKFSWQLAFSGLLYGSGHSILYPVLSMLFVNSGSDRENYTLNNLFTAFYTCGSVALPVLLGFLGDSLGSASVFVVMSVLSFAVGIYSFILTGNNEEDVLYVEESKPM